MLLGASSRRLGLLFPPWPAKLCRCALPKSVRDSYTNFRRFLLSSPVTEITITLHFHDSSQRAQASGPQNPDPRWGLSTTLRSFHSEGVAWSLLALSISDHLICAHLLCIIRNSLQEFQKIHNLSDLPRELSLQLAISQYVSPRSLSQLRIVPTPRCRHFYR